MNKIHSVMLVDDDHPTNVYHRLMLEEAEATDHIAVCQTGVEALEYLYNCPPSGDNKVPQLIFLDINMPRMNGFQFLEEFKKLDAELRQGVVIMMLTTSLSEVEEERARNIGIISDFRIKPLSVEMIEEIVKTHFSNNA